MASRYAATTDVPVERSRSEIERVLRAHGATAFQCGWDDNQAAILFELGSRRILFRLQMPDRNDPRFTHSAHRDRWRRVELSDAAKDARYEQACRALWRALLLVIKAKLEAVAAGIVTLESEFLAHVVLPDGSTVAEHVAPKIALAYEHGQMPALLPGASPNGTSTNDDGPERSLRPAD